MYHVATMLPFDEADEQRIERKTKYGAVRCLANTSATEAGAILREVITAPLPPPPPSFSYLNAVPLASLKGANFKQVSSPL